MKRISDLPLIYPYETQNMRDVVISQIVRTAQCTSYNINLNNQI